MTKVTPEELAAHIDHTLLKPEATRGDMDRLCEEGLANKFASIVVASAWVPYCGAVLSQTPDSENEEEQERKLLGMGSRPPIGLCAVVSFPLGNDSDTAKSFAAEDAIRKGATEIDMVMNLGFAKGGMWDDVEEETAGIRAGIDKWGMDVRPVLKVIIETPLLTDDEITTAAKRVVEGGADFVKTNTGWVGEGAKVEHVKLIREAIGGDAKIKASAGIRTLEQATALIEAGADRIGTSAAMDILAEARSQA